MKRSILLILTLILLFAALSAAAGQTPVYEDLPTREPPKVGVLSYLNLSEEPYAVMMMVREMVIDLMIKQGYIKMNYKGPEPVGRPEPEDGERPERQAFTIMYFDRLTDMLMALQAGDVDRIEVYQCVAKYLAANNPELEYGFEFDYSKEQSVFVQKMLPQRLGNGFSFLMKEENRELADQFNGAIRAMKEDGTMDRLAAEYLDGVKAGDPAGIPLPQIDGAETISVAVTGDLPPMDFISADGLPAGFNTAILAEISHRIGRNINIVEVDSAARSLALESGLADVVFWTRTVLITKPFSGRPANDPPYMKDLSEEEQELFREIREISSIDDYVYADIPEGTISTEVYFTDVIVPVMMKRK